MGLLGLLVTVISITTVSWIFLMSPGEDKFCKGVGFGCSISTLVLIVCYACANSPSH